MIQYGVKAWYDYLETIDHIKFKIAIFLSHFTFNNFVLRCSVFEFLFSLFGLFIYIVHAKFLFILFSLGFKISFFIL